MRPLAELDPRGVRALLFDLDETLTSGGKLTADAYAALEKLHSTGRRTIAVTGRPAGWCDHIARMWPVDAVVGENGAFYFYFAEGKLRTRFADDDATRAAKRSRLDAIAKKVLRDVPGSAISSDQAYRETDLAIDYREDVPPLPLETAERIAAIMREAGLTARVSSIHVNGWFGEYDKLTMTRLLFQERFAAALDRQVAYVGDSPNDAPMFDFFENSVGVANVRRFKMASRPKFVTQASAGAGFAELVAHLLRS